MGERRAVGPAARQRSGLTTPAAPEPPGTSAPALGGAPRSAWPWKSPLAARLVAAFVAVAFGSLVISTTLTLLFARADISSLSRTQQQDLANATASAAQAVYRAHGSWSGADLSPALAPASDFGGMVTITDADGQPVAGASTYPSGQRPGRPTAIAPIVVTGERVGTVEVQAAPGGLTSADRRLRNDLSAAVIASAALTLVAALGVAVLASRRLLRPLVALIDATRAVGAGHREVTVGGSRGPGELGELAHAFDTMADSLNRHDELRRALVADVAHELRTPVAVLLATCEALVDGVADPTPETLSSLRDEALRLTSRVADLEALAAAEAASLSLDRQPLDVADVARDAANALARQFDAAGVSLRCDMRPVTVLGDRARVHQIVTNLLANAVKFTPSGGTVDLATGPAPMGGARIEVGDTGPGIPPEELEFVFQRFWRGRQSGTVPGSGIGLAIVSELARAHGGEATVASLPAQGARFTITLPAVR
jgi:two-component system sensor histidine kinase BaeS